VAVTVVVVVVAVTVVVVVVAVTVVVVVVDGALVVVVVDGDVVVVVVDGAEATVTACVLVEVVVDVDLGGRLDVERVVVRGVVASVNLSDNTNIKIKFCKCIFF
jgi:hypothetical protein